MANRTKRTIEKDEKFFTALAGGEPVSAAAQQVGYTRTSVYEWRQADEEFAARWAEAIEIAIERLEAEADRRGVDGVEKPVFYRGKQCGTIREYSDTLLMFRLKRLDPRYRDRFDLQHSGADGGPVAMTIADVVRRAAAADPDYSRLTDDELEQLRALEQKMMPAPGKN